MILRNLFLWNISIQLPNDWLCVAVQYQILGGPLRFIQNIYWQKVNISNKFQVYYKDFKNLQKWLSTFLSSISNGNNPAWSWCCIHNAYWFPKVFRRYMCGRDKNAGKCIINLLMLSGLFYPFLWADSYQMECLLNCFYHHTCISYRNSCTWGNSVDPDQMSRLPASDLGLHYLLVSL